MRPPSRTKVLKNPEFDATNHDTGNRDLPEYQGRSIRADMVVRESDRTENWRAKPPAIDPKDLSPVHVEVERPDPIIVEAEKGSGQIIVSVDTGDGKKKQICSVTWKPQGQYYLVHRMVDIAGKHTEWIEHKSRLPEAWQVAGKFFVTPDEFQQAMTGVPSPARWNFDDCPFNRIDCSFVMVGDNRSSRVPDLRCRVCGSTFLMSEKEIDKYGRAKLELKEPGICPTTTTPVPPVEPPLRPSDPSEPATAPPIETVPEPTPEEQILRQVYAPSSPVLKPETSNPASSPMESPPATSTTGSEPS